MRKYINFVLSGAMFLTAVVIFYFFYLLFFPTRVATITKITITPAVVHGGEMVHGEASYCKKINSVSTIIRTIETVHDHNVVVPYPYLASDAPVGCGLFEFDTMLPVKMTPGTYQMDFTVIYQANPLRAVSEEYYSNTFQVK